MDVARKLIILAREMGLRTELGEVKVESLVPAELTRCGIEEFLERLPEFDASDAARGSRGGGLAATCCATSARSTRRAAREVGLVELPRSHPFANIALTDNIVRFQTARYDKNPLIVQGPGAGPAVTAAGVFADLLRVCAYLGAKL